MSGGRARHGAECGRGLLRVRKRESARHRQSEGEGSDLSLNNKLDRWNSARSEGGRERENVGEKEGLRREESRARRGRGHIP